MYQYMDSNTHMDFSWGKDRLIGVNRCLCVLWLQNCGCSADVEISPFTNFRHTKTSGIFASWVEGGQRTRERSPEVSATAFGTALVLRPFRFLE